MRGVPTPMSLVPPSDSIWDLGSDEANECSLRARDATVRFAPRQVFKDTVYAEMIRTNRQSKSKH